ncbi:hypothetical protein D3C84_816060 [compost metagenome]
MAPPFNRPIHLRSDSPQHSYESKPEYKPGFHAGHDDTLLPVTANGASDEQPRLHTEQEDKAGHEHVYPFQLNGGVHGRFLFFSSFNLRSSLAIIS